MQKDAQKGDFWNSLDPLWGFILKTVPGIHDPCISGLPFGTTNHKMQGPPVGGNELKSDNIDSLGVKKPLKTSDIIYVHSPS